VQNFGNLGNGRQPAAVWAGADYTAAMHSISTSKCPGQAGTQTKIRAGESLGK